VTRKVVVSGMAAWTPIGCGLDAFASALAAGEGGVAPIRRFDTARHRVRRAAEVAWEKPAGSRLSRATEMALAVAAAAAADAGLEPGPRRGEATAVILACSQGGMAAAGGRYRELARPYRRGPVAGELAARMLDAAPSAALDPLAAAHGASIVVQVATACSAGLHALGLARDLVRDGVVVRAVVVGAEVLSEFTVAGFSVLRLLTAGDAPRPFAADRDGTSLGEGAAAMVVEPDEAVRARGGRAWVELAGYGSSSDASHMTRPDAEGPARAVGQALAEAGNPAIGWVKAHGTGTRHNDAAESAALHRVFRRTAPPPVTSLKAALGHSLGASGLVEAAGAAVALRGGFVPPVHAAGEADPDLELDLVAGPARPSAAGAVLVNAFGFGGNNAAMVLRAA